MSGTSTGGPLALVVPPDGPARIERLDAANAAAELHALVDGDLEVIVGGDWCAYLDEHYQRHERRGNANADHLARALGWQSHPSEYLCGTVVFLGRNRHREIDVPERILRMAGMQAGSAPTTEREPQPMRLRLRVWVDGELADETWLPGDVPHAGKDAGHRHRALTEAADAAGKLWLVELFDPSEPETTAYMRYGTDRRGMVLPLLLLGDDLTMHPPPMQTDN
jgi:hypothetical protein